MTPSHAAAFRKGAVEALTGAHAGWVLSREIAPHWVPTVLPLPEGEMSRRKSARACLTLRGRRPHARMEACRLGTGRSSGRPQGMELRAASERQKAATR